MSFEFITIGDLHLTDEKGNGGLSRYINNFSEYMMSECQRVINYAKKRGIEHVFILGDISNGIRLSYESMIALIKFFKLNEEIKFYVMLGNHDMMGMSSEQKHSLQVLMLLEKDLFNVTFITTPKQVTIENIKFRILPWPYSKQTSKDCINLIHDDVNQSKMDTGRIIKNTKKNNTDHFILAGHIHTNHRVRNTFYVGSLIQQNFGEKLPKYFQHIKYKNKDDYQVIDVPFDPRIKLHTIIASSKNDLPTDFSKFDLVRLICMDGSDITASDYSHLNVVQLRSAQSKIQLQTLLEEQTSNIELNNLSWNTSDVIKDFLKNQNIDNTLKKSTWQLRKSILKQEN